MRPGWRREPAVMTGAGRAVSVQEPGLGPSYIEADGKGSHRGHRPKCIIYVDCKRQRPLSSEAAVARFAGNGGEGPILALPPGRWAPSRDMNQ